MSNPDYSRQNEAHIRDLQNADLQSRELRDRELRDRELRAYETRRQAEIARDNANTSGGLFLGLMLAAIAGFTTLFIALAQRSDTQPQVEPAAPPEVNVQPPEVNIQQAPPPDVNVTIPETAPQAAPPQSTDPSLDPMMGAPESSTDSMNTDPTMTPDGFVAQVFQKPYAVRKSQLEVLLRKPCAGRFLSKSCNKATPDGTVQPGQP